MLPRTVEVINQGIAEGLHLGAQVYASLAGRVVADLGIGDAREGVPMTPDTIMLWLSSGKPVGGVALAQLWERSRLDLDTPVCRFIPEFGNKGKEAVTLRHLLTHTGGFRFADVARREAPWEELIASICAAKLEPGWIPGAKAGYHPASSWFLLAEIVRRIDGRPYSRYVREEIFEPLGLRDSWVGIPPEQLRAYGDHAGIIYDTQGERPVPSVLDSEAHGLTYRPGGSARGPIRDLGRFYEMLLFRGQRDGARILSPQTVEALTARHRAGMFDLTFQHVMDWGLGFIIDSKMYGADTAPYGYGPYASPRTFGHSGYRSSVGYCDPEHGLVVAVVANGTPAEERHQRRFRAISAAIYEDLAIAEPRLEH